VKARSAYPALVASASIEAHGDALDVALEQPSADRFRAHVLRWLRR
jgi:hypothetical protein